MQTTKKKELGEGEKVVLFQSFRELIALDVDLNKNPETSDFCITQPLCLEEKKVQYRKHGLIGRFQREAAEQWDYFNNTETSLQDIVIFLPVLLVLVTLNVLILSTASVGCV